MEDTTAESRMIEVSQAGIASICSALQKLLPGAIIKKNECTFAAMLPNTSWVGTYTEMDICDKKMATITIRRVNPQTRRVEVRGSETFDSIEEAIIFVCEVVVPTRPRECVPNTSAHATEDIRIIARGSVHEKIEPEEAAADQRAISNVGL